MSVTFLGISVGNTRTQLGVFIEGKLQDSRVVAAQDAAALEVALRELTPGLPDQDQARVLLASVNAAGASAAEQVVASTLGKPILRIEQDVVVPIGRQLDPETIVGQDRLLNAAAAYDTLKQACIVVDAGTAITVDLIDGQGTFHGGAIGPGATMMLKSLHDHTAQLPEVAFDKPQEPIGHNTAEAMRSAVFHGLRGMVRELVEQYAEHIGAYPVVVATGGDAQVLFAEYELVDRVVPDLALIGLRVAMASYVRQED